MPKYLVKHPIVPGMDKDPDNDAIRQTQKPILPGGSIELPEEEAQYLLDEGIIETDKMLSERKLASAEEKRERAKALKEEAERLEKEASEAPKALGKEESSDEEDLDIAEDAPKKGARSKKS